MRRLGPDYLDLVKIVVKIRQICRFANARNDRGWSPASIQFRTPAAASLVLISDWIGRSETA